MAPTRHETAGGAGPPDTPDTTSGYGTRSSKRKVSEVSTNGTSDPPSSGKRAATRATKKSAPANENNEAIQSPTKKRRSSTAVKTPEPLPESESELNLSEASNSEGSSPENGVPAITVEAPAEQDESSPDANPDDEKFSIQTPATWDELPDVEQPTSEAVSSNSTKPPTRGRGRGRGRGWRGGKAKSIPKPTAAPKARGGWRGRGRGGRRKASMNPRIDALSARAAELKSQYNALAKLQKRSLELLAEKSLEKVKGDPTYHKSIPEYEKVTDDLEMLYEERLAGLQRQQLAEEEEARNWFEYCSQGVEKQLEVSF